MLNLKSLALGVVEANRGFEAEDPLTVWDYISFHYGYDVDLDVIREAQKQVREWDELVLCN